MLFFQRKGTIYTLLDGAIKDINTFFENKSIRNHTLRMKLLKPLLRIRWTQDYVDEVYKINKALESKGEKILRAKQQYEEDLLVAEREEKPTEIIKAKLEVLRKLIE